jgi:hypothetical protein
MQGPVNGINHWPPCQVITPLKRIDKRQSIRAPALEAGPVASRQRRRFIEEEQFRIAGTHNRPMPPLE